jgi:3-hydroxyisobutyrate dehydrogenase-like beta-hydroxyacid dehydrogenase
MKRSLKRFTEKNTAYLQARGAISGMHIGFVGLGQIGTEMVKRLRTADFPVTVYPRGGGLAEARAAGVAECADYARLAAQSDALILIMFNDEQVRDILFGQGALAAMRPGTVLTIHVTGSPALRREIQEKAPEGVDVLDTTFSGSVAGTRNGTLTLMVGGSETALERMRPLYETYATNIFHVGAPGDAQVLKLLNNLVLAANMMNVAELLKVGESYGLNPRTVARVLQTCSGASLALGIFERREAAEAMENARKYMSKDVEEAVLAAKDAGLNLGAFEQTIDYWLAK